MKRRYLLLAGYGIFGTALFLTFLTASFPYGDAISNLLAPMNMKVLFQQQVMDFPIGAQLQNVQLISAVNNKLLLHSPNVSMSPGLLCFFLGQPCLRLRAQIFGGRIDATIRRYGQSTIVEFQLESLNLQEVSVEAAGAGLPAREPGEGGATHNLDPILSGDLSGRGSVQVMGADFTRARASLMLIGRNVRAALVNGMPALELGMLHGNLLLRQGIATLQDVGAHGVDGDLLAGGEIHLSPDIVSSTLQLVLSLRPSATARANFGVFLNALPHAPSAGPYHLEGPLQFPMVS